MTQQRAVHARLVLAGPLLYAWQLSRRLLVLVLRPRRQHGRVHQLCPRPPCFGAASELLPGGIAPRPFR
eukprot:13768441-Alexandrium_andersonii.AAC.1